MCTRETSWFNALDIDNGKYLNDHDQIIVYSELNCNAHLDVTIVHIWYCQEQWKINANKYEFNSFGKHLKCNGQMY